MLKKTLTQPINTLKNFKKDGEIQALFPKTNTIMPGTVTTTMWKCFMIFCI